jgi:hypothetical protein
VSTELPALVAAAERVARFMETLDDADREGAFARDVVIMENFPPHVFSAPVDPSPPGCSRPQGHEGTLRPSSRVHK